jgi:RND family efflux transporter MFP subunit
MIRRTTAVGVALVVAILAAGGAVYVSRTPHGGAVTPATAPATSYHCPMHPTMVSDRPGDCPICGMRMVRIEEGEGAPHTAVHGAAPPEHDPSAGKDAAAPQAEQGQAGAAPGAQKRIIYRSTMNPNEMSDRPGKDSMGMDMVPEEIEAPRAGSGAAVDGRVAVKVSAQKRQLIGVRTGPVEKGPFTRTIRTVGRVTYDESRLRNVFTKVSGWVERLYANTTGQLVKEGAPLLSIYSPDLVSSAQEYLLALRGRDQLAGSEMAGDSSKRLVDSARRRLLLFDLTPQQISALQKTGKAPTTMTLHAPISGNIITRYVTQGDRIEPGTKLLDIAELSQVWVLADIYEYELPFVRLGQAATMTLSYLPGRAFEGRITFIYPTLSEATRTVKVRLEFPNPDFTLKPEMYAQVEIRSDLGETLTVPESAVISTGTRDIVFVDRGEGYFEPREVKLGIRLPDRFEVLDGVAEGEPVLTSGNFLVDSESKLKAALAAAGSDTAGAAAGPSH